MLKSNELFQSQDVKPVVVEVEDGDTRYTASLGPTGEVRIEAHDNPPSPAAHWDQAARRIVGAVEPMPLAVLDSLSAQIAEALERRREAEGEHLEQRADGGRFALPSRPSELVRREFIAASFIACATAADKVAQREAAEDIVNRLGGVPATELDAAPPSVRGAVRAALGEAQRALREVQRSERRVLALESALVDAAQRLRVVDEFVPDLGAALQVLCTSAPVLAALDHARQVVGQEHGSGAPSEAALCSRGAHAVQEICPVGQPFGIACEPRRSEP